MKSFTISTIVAFTLCSCNLHKQEARTSMEGAVSDGQNHEEFHRKDEIIRKIEGWDIGVVGAGAVKRFVELPSMKPIRKMNSDQMFVDNEWGFAILTAEEGVSVVEWPSLKPIRLSISTRDKINLDKISLPESRWTD